MYPIELTTPMANELINVGFKSLTTQEQVDQIFDAKGSTLVVVNSVCGCAASNARPGAKMAIQHSKRPENLVTVFAGVDKEAVSRAREYMQPYPPSSPSIALFNDGEIVFMLERHQIEGRSADLIAEKLKEAFDQFC